jgi:hypothetical protein
VSKVRHLAATGSGDIFERSSLQQTRVMSHNRYYQQATVATDEDVTSPTVATKGFNNDVRFDNITEQPLYQQVTRCLLLQSNPRCYSTFVVVGVIGKPYKLLIFGSQKKLSNKP